MSDPDHLTVREALHLHYQANALPTDGGRSAQCWTMVKLGPVSIRLSNFSWRRNALPSHDLHHLLTGYPCTKIGEFQIAAWEFSAGRFPSTLSTMFCLPLVGIGALIVPGLSFAAFVRGRQSRTLYSVGVTPELLDMELEALRISVVPQNAEPASWGDRVAYTALVALSLTLVAGPAIGLATLLLRSG